MASILAKIGWKRMRKRENKKQKSSLRFVSTQRVIENSKNIAKKLKKLKNTIMASFQKNSNKIQKIKKYHYGFSLSQNRL